MAACRSRPPRSLASPVTTVPLRKEESSCGDRSAKCRACARRSPDGRRRRRTIGGRGAIGDRPLCGLESRGSPLCEGQRVADLRPRLPAGRPWLALVPRDRRPGTPPGVPASFLVRDACPHDARPRGIDRGAERLGGDFPPTTGRDHTPGGRVRSWSQPRPADGRRRYGHFPAL